MKRIIILPSLNIDPVIFFRGTEAEQEEAEAREAERKTEIEKIIFNPNFQQLTYITENGQIHSLHRSTRQGVMYQLSFIDVDGIPAMHENYIKTAQETVNEFIHSRKDLTRHYIRKTQGKPLKLELITE